MGGVFGVYRRPGEALFNILVNFAPVVAEIASAAAAMNIVFVYRNPLI